jgi:rRNA maturation endonuclease Nob1
MSVLQRIRDLLTEEQDRSRERRASSNLYRCDSCNTTYVSVEMDSCSSCGGAVDTIPTETDLGLT